MNPKWNINNSGIKGLIARWDLFKKCKEGSIGLNLIKFILTDQMRKTITVILILL